jgi:hypothetical protein
VIPESKILEKFYKSVKPLFEKIEINSEYIQSLLKTRDLLLQK